MITILDRLFGIFIGIEFREDSLVVSLLKNSLSGIRLLSSSSFPMRDDEVTLAAIREHIERHSPGTGRVFVSIPDRWALIKFTEVPSIKGKGKDALPNLMKYEIERHIPFDIDTVLYDFQILEETASTYTVAFVTVQKKRVEHVREFLQKLSLEPHSITVSSFALLNSIELGGIAAGGWQSIVGIVPGGSVFGGKGESVVSLHIDASAVRLAVLRNGYCQHLRTFSMPPEGQAGDLPGLVSDYLDEVKSELDISSYHKLIVSGDDQLLPGLAAGVSERTGAEAVTVEPIPSFPEIPESVEKKNLPSSIGGAFGELGIGRYRINILPHKLDYEIKRVASFATKVFAGVVILLLIGIVSVQSYKQKDLLNRIDEELRKNEPKIARYMELSAEFRAYKEQSDFLTAIKSSEITLEVLAELSRLLPDDTWISNLQYNGPRFKDGEGGAGELLLSGYSDSAPKLISILEGSAYFESVEFVGTIKKARGKEGFKIKASVTGPERRDNK
jgi:Tfp pilus assembly PilM family ATPase